MCVFSGAEEGPSDVFVISINLCLLGGVIVLGI
jgi:hypothetical protein